MKKSCFVDVGSASEKAQAPLDDRPTDIRFDQLCEA